MEDNLTPEEQGLFDSLSKEMNPSPELEDRIVNELIKKQLIKPKVMKSNNRKLWIVRIAASILFFFFGYLIGGTGDRTPDISAGYILLLHEDENFQPVGTDMEIFGEYAAWMGKMMLNGIGITGKELSPESTAWVSDKGNQGAVDIGKDKISGYFIIDVTDQNEAESIAASSPHTKFGGTVELIKLSDRN